MDIGRTHLSSFTLIVSFVCLALVGLSLVPQLPVKLNPSRSLPGFTVSYSMQDASSRVVEMEVTSKLEAMFGAHPRGGADPFGHPGNGWGRITVDLGQVCGCGCGAFRSIHHRAPDLAGTARRGLLSYDTDEGARRGGPTAFPVLHPECSVCTHPHPAVC